jgi:hypothetical protein
MNKPRDDASPPSPGEESSAPDDSNTASTPSSGGKRTGRIVHDERGNSIWEWQLETGVYTRDISTQRLKKLDLDDLSIADTAIHPAPQGLTDPPGSWPRGRLPGGGFNPYDNSTTGGGNVARDPYSGVGRGALKPEPAERRRKPVDLRKLQEWIELRKRVEQNKREEGDD